MGQSFSQAVDDPSDLKVMSGLLKAERRMREKLECVKAKLYIGALNDECIPIVCAVDTFNDTILIENSEEKTAEDLESKVRYIITSHLDMGNHDKKLITAMVKNVVMPNLKLLEEKKTIEEQYTHVVYANESFIRFDYHIHFENLQGERFALFYFGQVGLLDVQRARMPVLIYELKRATDNLPKEAANELRELRNLKMSSMEEVVEFLNKRWKLKKGKH